MVIQPKMIQIFIKKCEKEAVDVTKIKVTAEYYRPVFNPWVTRVFFPLTLSGCFTNRIVNIENISTLNLAACRSY